MVDRFVPFTGIYNFRDFGDYPTVDGRTVARGRLFRSDTLSRLTVEDTDRFTALGIRTVIDLRRPTEVATYGRIPEFTGVVYRHAHVAYEPWDLPEHTDLAERIAYLVARYRHITTEGGEGIGLALRLIAQTGSAPVAVHCFAGMDRTGIVAALTLALLGVDDETVAADYALSDLAAPAFFAAHNFPTSAIATTPAGAILGLLAELRAEHGSLEAYAKSIGVTDDHLADLRARLLT